MSQVEDRSPFQVEAAEWKVTNKPSTEEPPLPPWAMSAGSLVPGMYTSSKIPKLAPDMSLELAWVYGYQAEKSKNNVRYTSVGEAVYHSGKYAITYSFDGHSQKIFTGHCDEILCLAMHPVRSPTVTRSHVQHSFFDTSFNRMDSW